METYGHQECTHASPFSDGNNTLLESQAVDMTVKQRTSDTYSPVLIALRLGMHTCGTHQRRLTPCLNHGQCTWQGSGDAHSATRSRQVEVKRRRTKDELEKHCSAFLEPIAYCLLPTAHYCLLPSAYILLAIKQI